MLTHTYAQERTLAQSQIAISLTIAGTLQHDKDLGFLINPGNGPVPCLEFFCPLTASGVPSPSPSHMFSGSSDGSIAIWKAGHQWEHLKLMKVRMCVYVCVCVCPCVRAFVRMHACVMRDKRAVNTSRCYTGSVFVVLCFREPDLDCNIDCLFRGAKH